MSATLPEPVPAQAVHLTDFLDDRTPRREVRATVRKITQACRRRRAAEASAEVEYGALPAERDSVRMRRQQRKADLKSAKREVRGAMLSRVGRRIDLPSLLRQLGADGRPNWALVDPTQPLMTNGVRNHSGKRDSDGTIAMFGLSRSGTPEMIWVEIPGAKWTPPGGGSAVAFLPAGIPALPEVARRLATAPGIRRRAIWVGLLYQPDAWLEARPDPAIVVEWRDRPGEYYALAVWGDDRARIMEWVD